MGAQEAATHPLLACAQTARAAFKDVADVDPLFMPTDAKAEALAQASAVVEAATELLVRLLASADDVAEAGSHRDAAAYLAHQTRRDPAECRRLLRLGRDLQRHPATAAAVREGAATTRQAEVIARAVHELPAHTDPEVVARAEEHLVELAEQFAPRPLARCGRRVLEVVDPDAAEEHERRRLADEEAHAARATFCRYRRNGDGTTDIRLRLADMVADRMLAYLHAYLNPRRQAADAERSEGARQTGDDASAARSGAGAPAGDRRPYEERMGHAFGDLMAHLDPDRMPLHGGDATTVVVTISLEELRRSLGLAEVGDGHQAISAAEARRLACTANIIPTVLGGQSEVLDLGRTRRLFSAPQRKALALRQRTCRAEGCDIPARWCEAHHASSPWSSGGRTDLADGLLLCSFHHHRAHDPRYETRWLPPERSSVGGVDSPRVRFVRRT